MTHFFCAFSIWRVQASAVLLLGLSSACAMAAPNELTLGRALFYERNLSVDRSVSCASCHSQVHAFSDTRPTSVGNRHQTGTRKAPSLLEVGSYQYLFWDGRSDSLNHQVAFPLFGAVEMGLSGDAELLARVRESPRYVRLLERLTGDQSDRQQASAVRTAIATYVRSLRPSRSAYEAYVAGDSDAISSQAKMGLDLFTGRAGCSNCHVVDGEKPFLSDNQFHESSVGMRAVGADLSGLVLRLTHTSVQKRLDLVPKDPRVAALGRFVVTLDPKDIGAFRTPSLRFAARAGPYMHDGSVATLQEAVDLELYYRGLKQGYPVNLSLAERRAIRVFIESMSAAPPTPNRNFGNTRTASRSSGHPNSSVSTHHE